MAAQAAAPPTATMGEAGGNVSRPHDNPSVGASLNQSSAQSDASRGAPAPLPVSAEFQKWRTFVQSMREANPRMAAFLELVAPRSISNDLVALTIAHSAFLHSQLELDENIAALRVEIERSFSSTTKLEFRDPDGSPLHTVDTVQAEEHKEALRAARREVEGNPLVQEIVRLFGAEIKNIRVPGEDA